MQNEQKGKNQIIAIIVVILLIDIITILSTSSIFSTSGNTGYLSQETVQGLLRLMIECVILYYVYKGHNGAKWLLTILLFIGGLGRLITLKTANYIILGIGIVYIGIGIALITSKPIKDFLIHQKDKFYTEEKKHDESNQAL